MRKINRAKLTYTDLEPYLKEDLVPFQIITVDEELLKGMSHHLKFERQESGDISSVTISSIYTRIYDSDGHERTADGIERRMTSIEFDSDCLLVEKTTTSSITIRRGRELLTLIRPEWVMI